MTTDNTQELDEILDDIYYGGYLGPDTLYPGKAKQAILDWHNKQVEAVLERLKVPTINDVFPSEPYDGTRTYEDMLSVVSYYERLIQAERNKLKESK